jgi:hypothetical protein
MVYLQEKFGGRKWLCCAAMAPRYSANLWSAPGIISTFRHTDDPSTESVLGISCQVACVPGGHEATAAQRSDTTTMVGDEWCSSERGVKTGNCKVTEDLKCRANLDPRIFQHLARPFLCIATAVARGNRPIFPSLGLLFAYYNCYGCFIGQPKSPCSSFGVLRSRTLCFSIFQPVVCGDHTMPPPSTLR